ncbi:hypothetical protein FIT67_04540 [Candidatus Methylopumilus planktonicus]|uniref:hypothetical protein n=1 Tax=Candidatus Methylopumilus planktonicus TaxID=1581557 RepID=UPI001122508D|nr:hypothetical protein [Candidatus Methylopumilus planktonicus]QDD07094.1 hypothetical protein FIT67_04540 [Candidatus Methylopumilus planktonicus]
MKYLLLFLLIFSSQVFGEDLSSFEKTCKQIGFKPKTTDYGDCVLELRNRELKKTKVKVQKVNKVVPEHDLPEFITDNQEPLIKSAEIGDGSNNDKICQQYGFKVGEDSYKKCRLDLDVAQRQAEAEMAQFEQQKLQYEEQKRRYEAAVKAEHDRREFQAGVNILMYGLGLAGGRTRDEAAPALYGLPMYPRQPTFQNFTITTPRGHSNCVYNTRMNLMNCY